MRRVESKDGVAVAVRDLGGSGRPVLFAHATGFHGRVWGPLAARLADAFHGYALDFRGQGHADHPDAEYHWRDFGADVLAAVDGLGLAGAPLLGVGHSKGAAALLMAEQDRPGTFTALYCYEPIVLPVDEPPGRTENRLSAGARKRKELFESKEAAYANFASKPPFDALHPDVLAAYVEHGFEEQAGGTVRLRCPPEYEARIYAMGFAHDAFSRFGEVGCPVTVACGEHTDAFGPDLVARQAARLPSGRVEVLPGLGHFGPLQDPDAVAAAIRRAFAGG